MTPRIRPSPPAEGRSSPLRALNERRVDPGTLARENIDTRAPLSTHAPRGQDNTGMPTREPMKR